ncbi:DUF4126 domain-containing protein [Seonamhaeicola marinus]|uniref:DUF4126 domain-containing protein n=1 Tax=Seonamhaeicola marinus TaxID=1912246 RepID=A0A5D0HL03_9FLAO|nr:DUF4126 domain-containing protein [Seonamhaeicola marinus]TYA71996.1 DUF4126 domain-containing protein [Seonamhaeicola marinus]
MNPETIISICLGIGLSASVGFRVFVPLFALSLAAHFDYWALNESWQWIGSTTALITLGAATLVEITAYFIPYIDNLLDTIAVPLAGIAGTIVMLSTVANLDPAITWSLAIIAGGGTAAAVAGTSSTTRLASTATTAGVGNPIVSIIETGTSIIMSIISVVLPYLAIILVIILLFVVFKLFKKFKKGISKPE